MTSTPDVTASLSSPPEAGPSSSGLTSERLPAGEVRPSSFAPLTKREDGGECSQRPSEGAGLNAEINNRRTSLGGTQSFRMSSMRDPMNPSTSINYGQYTNSEVGNECDPWCDQRLPTQNFTSLPPLSQTCSLCNAGSASNPPSNMCVANPVPAVQSDGCQPSIPDLNHTVSNAAYGTTLVPSLRRSSNYSVPHIPSALMPTKVCSELCTPSTWNSSPNTPIHGFRSRTPSQVLQNIHASTHIPPSSRLAHPNAYPDYRARGMLCSSYSCEALPTGRPYGGPPSNLVNYPRFTTRIRGPEPGGECGWAIDQSVGTLRRREDCRTSDQRHWE